jgi:DNA-binding IclR family transcriptional regulator
VARFQSRHVCVTQGTEEDSSRQRVSDGVHASPGIHVAQLARFLDLAPNTVLHHTNRLRNAGMLRQSKRQQRLHLFPSLIPHDLEDAIIACRYGATHDVLLHLGEDPTASLAKIVRERGLSRRVVGKAVAMMTTHGMLKRRGRTHVKLDLDLEVLDRVRRFAPEVLPSLHQHEQRIP